MLVVGLSDADSAGEREFAGELRRWVGQYRIPGVALLGPLDPAHVDALILTPGGCVIVEIKSLTKDAGGPITVPANGVWTIAGAPLDVFEQESWRQAGKAAVGRGNPLGQVNGYSSKFGPRIRRAGFPSAFVESLVVLVQHQGLRRRGVEKISIAGGIARFPQIHAAVTTLTRGEKGSPLRRYFHELQANPRSVWDIEAVHALLTMLEFGLDDPRCPTAADLEQEGFRHHLDVARSVTAVLPREAPPAALEWTRSPTPARWHVSTAPPPPPPALPRLAPAPVPLYTPPSRRPRRRTTLLTVVGLLLTVAAVFTAWSALAGLSSSPGRSMPTPASATPSPVSATFASSTGNIACRGTSRLMRCDINMVRYNMRTVPVRCRSTPNWGHVFVLELGRAARLECPAARMTTASTHAGKLVLNQARRTGAMTCVSRSAWFQCSLGPHGFRIGQSSYRIW